MKKTIIASLLLGLFAGSATVAQAVAGEAIHSLAVAQAQVGASASQAGQFSDWLPQVMQRFNSLPEVQAQEARRQQAQMSIEAADKAVYNPELGLGYQNATEDTYSLDISQTIDWGDKRGVATRIAQLESEILLSNIVLERNQMLAERLLALTSQSQARKALEFQRQQFEIAKAQLDIARQRTEVGDMSQVELQLMQLDVASNAADYALAEQASIAADGAVLALFGEFDLPFEDFVNALSLQASHIQVSPELPALKSAYQQVLVAKVSTEQAKADSSADPSISLSAEREGDENKFGVGVSIPLQIRNNYSEAIAVANQGVVIAEQTYLAAERILLQQQKQFSLSLPRLTQRYQDWSELVLTSGSKAASSLSQQWQAGDINTSDYLQSQRQMSSSYLAGLTLESALYENWLNWMGASGQLEGYLNSQLSTQGAASASVQVN
ncbi:outer membrane efflux family protein, putative [Shewanella halifaxensis HAW-EB4]|uniref:Outer membrane efflux family protein, putative n=1 Tax=Shewanella halifaxensis (strain HAW-EB4) TaxID=458817 RepID=B0TS41_SHEHH|nr:TolC family protein [Shewanella halifaxensis]ABZ75176.1 outer membrane efflux family protein, putative [Shewanella halifaxensis HAW-EB4]